MIRWHVEEILEQKGLNTQQFAELAGVTYNTALDLRRGASRRVDIETLDKVCTALGCKSVADLLEYVPPAPASKGKGK